jgi:hypothetical protein
MLGRHKCRLKTSVQGIISLTEGFRKCWDLDLVCGYLFWTWLCNKHKNGGPKKKNSLNFYYFGYPSTLDAWKIIFLKKIQEIF